MPKYQLSQKFLSIAENFEVRDIDGNLKYSAKGKFFSFAKSFDVHTASGKPVAKITQKLFSFRPTFNVHLNTGQRLKIIKTFFPLFQSQFLISYENKEIVASGNFLSHEFQFTLQDKVIATVSKQWFALTDNYGLHVEEEQYSEIAICILLVIDAIHHGANHSSS